ncbi:MAG TPA: PAS domain S-box protein [Bryobacteraceae bacterium]|nr:PAS domain S-box protein [Bryobacteraceae bacterium]
MAYLTSSGAADRAEIRRLGSLYDLLSAFARAKTMPDIYDAALASLAAATDSDRSALLLFNCGGESRVEASRKLSPDCINALNGYSPWPLGTRDARPIIVPDAPAEPGLSHCRKEFVRDNVHSVAFVPVELDKGVFGGLLLCYPGLDECSENELTVAQLIASHLALAISRTRAESALGESERRLQSILENSPAVVFLKDLQGRYTLVNRRFEELFHLSSTDIVGKTDMSLFEPAVAEYVTATDRQVLETQQPLTVQEEIRYRDGSSRTYLTVKFPIEDSRGAISGVGGIAADVTEHKKLESTSTHVAAIVESSDDAIISKDLNGIVTSWNKSAERIFGYSAEEMVGKPIATLAAPDLISEMPGILDRIRLGQRVDHYETRRRTKDGRIIDVSLTVSPVRDTSGRVTGASKIARDITERRRTERELAVLLKREKAARKTAELLNRVGPLLASELSLSKVVQSVTDVATELVGAEFGSFFHNVVNEKGESYMLYTLSGVPRERFEQFPMPRNTEVFAPTFRGEAIVRSDDITRDPRYGKNSPHFGMPEGHLPVRSYLAAPVTSRSGEVLGGLFFGHSAPGIFTEQDESLISGIAAQAAIAMDNALLFEKTQFAQKQLSRSNEELRRANQDLETFAYSASHDLQEPLRTVIVTTQFLHRRYADKLPSEAKPLLSTIVSAAQRTESLIRDVLAYAMASKQDREVPQLIDSNKALNLALRDLEVLITESSAKVSRDVLPSVRAHPNRLAQLFANIIGNALKYHGPEPPRVHVSAYQTDGFWQFSITDNGIGIEPTYAGQIFSLFKRLHSQEEYPGSGIGLALCVRIVEQYGGRIWLERSAPGEGSTFCFTLPAVPKSRAE